MVVAAVRRLGERAVAASGISIDGGCILDGAGNASALVASGDLDVTGLDDAAAAAVTASLGHLLRGLEGPLQLIVQSRPWVARRASSPPPRPLPTAAAVATRLLEAEAEALDAMARSGTTMRRRVLLLVSARAGDPEQLERSAARVLSFLASCGISGRRLAGAELTATLEEAWGRSTTESEGSSDGPPRSTLLIAPPWSETRRWARSGDVLFRALRLRRLPGVAVTPGWLSPLLRLPVAGDVAIHLAPIPVTEALRRLERRLRGIRADQLAAIEREQIGSAGTEAGMEAALDLRWRLARNTASPLTLSITAAARATDTGELDHSADRMFAALNACLARPEWAEMEHCAAARATWPLGDAAATLPKLVDSAAATSCVPWVETIVDDPIGYPLGRAARTGTPIRLDPFDTSEHSNANVAVLAASGRGKSYAISGLILAAAARGIGAVVLDPEGEYAALVGALGGDYLELRPGCGAALNLFDAAGRDTEPGERRAELCGAAVALAAVLCGGRTDDVERAAVDAAMQAALSSADTAGRPALLGDCLPALRGSAPRVATVLGRFCSGPLGELFNRPTSIRLDGSVVGISLRDLRDELVPAATLIVAEWLWGLVRRNRRRRHVVVDEVGLLCAHPPLRTLLAQLARRCRKYDASLVIATQNAGDLLATEDGRVMATNPAIVLLGGHRGAETALMQRAYALTDAQRAMLEGAGRGEFLLLAGRRRLAMRIELPALQHALVTTGLAPAGLESDGVTPS